MLLCLLHIILFDRICFAGTRRPNTDQQQYSRTIRFGPFVLYQNPLPFVPPEESGCLQKTLQTVLHIQTASTEVPRFQANSGSRTPNGPASFCH